MLSRRTLRDEFEVEQSPASPTKYFLPYLASHSPTSNGHEVSHIVTAVAHRCERRTRVCAQPPRVLHACPPPSYASHILELGLPCALTTTPRVDFLSTVSLETGRIRPTANLQSSDGRRATSG